MKRIAEEMQQLLQSNIDSTKYNCMNIFNLWRQQNDIMISKVLLFTFEDRLVFKSYNGVWHTSNVSVGVCL